MTISPNGAVSPPAVTTSTAANGGGGTARRPATPALARRQVAERLRERRGREESLIVSAIDALARRAAALDEAASASQVLKTAVHDLAAMGISRDELAQILDVPSHELADQPTVSQKAPGPRRGK
jgi:hypothetical protein